MSQQPTAIETTNTQPLRLARRQLLGLGGGFATTALLAGLVQTGITMLKACYNEAFVLPDPQVPDEDGLALMAYPGNEPLTIGGELNKLAALLGLDCQIQATFGDLAIPSERILDLLILIIFALPLQTLLHPGECIPILWQTSPAQAADIAD